MMVLLIRRVFITDVEVDRVSTEPTGSVLLVQILTLRYQTMDRAVVMIFDLI
jgi:hypothetical protein